MNGFLCVLKPPGMTSSDVVVRVRRQLGRGAKVGHAGTLDPEAAGVLPIGIGAATRLFDYVSDKEKTYRAEVCVGAATDTQDAATEWLTTTEIFAAIKAHSVILNSADFFILDASRCFFWSQNIAFFIICQPLIVL